MESRSHGASDESVVCRRYEIDRRYKYKCRFATLARLSRAAESRMPWEGVVAFMKSKLSDAITWPIDDIQADKNRHCHQHGHQCAAEVGHFDNLSPAFRCSQQDNVTLPTAASTRFGLPQREELSRLASGRARYPLMVTLACSRL